MNILHFYKTFSPHHHGGTEMSIRQLCHGLKKRNNVNTTILSLSQSPADTIKTEHYTSHQTKTHLDIASTPMSLSAFKKFRELANKADIIHYHFPWPFMDMVHLVSGIKKPTLVTYESDIVKQKLLLQLYRPLMHRFLNSVDHIVTTSPNYLQTSEVLQRYQDKTSIIPIGLDKMSYPEPTDETIKQWQQKFDQPFFLFVGVLRYYKGLHILLEAAQNLNMPIVIVGSGPEEERLKKQAQILKPTNVHFLGALPETDKVALLNLCHAFVFPSHLRSEAFGISLLEGAMFGKPMISAEIGTGTSYINQHNKTGLVIQPNDANALKEAMITLYEDPTLAKNMGGNAEEQYWKNFTADKMGENYFELYEKLLSQDPLHLS